MTDSQTVMYTAAIIAIIGSLFTGIIQVIVAVKTNKKAEEIHTLVNGSATATLREITELKERIASLTGRSADSVAAVSAKTNLDEKVAAMSSLVK